MNEIHIPTLTGLVNVLNVSGDQAQNLMEYKANINQAGVGNPPTLIPDFPSGNPQVPMVDTLELNGVKANITFGYLGVGNYSLDSDQPIFTENNIMHLGFTNKFLSTDLGGNLTGLPTVLVNKGFTANQITMAVYDIINPSTPVDNFLNGTIWVQVYGTPATDSEGQFNNLLAMLDANQLLMWTKMVVRFGGTVTEIDGKKYRKTGDYAQSSKLINS